MKSRKTRFGKFPFFVNFLSGGLFKTYCDFSLTVMKYGAKIGVVSNPFTSVIPVPLHTKRTGKKGFLCGLQVIGKNMKYWMPPAAKS